MKLHILDTPSQLGEMAAQKCAALLRDAIRERGGARLILSTGASQFETIAHLRKQDIDWSRVELFHLDEYIGINASHPAGFVKYLQERFVGNGPPLKAAYFLDGFSDPAETIRTVTERLREKPVDAALIGIGENGHIAFNDPPADFDTREAFITVTLDDACKTQQIREKWFESIADVPQKAITMTPYQIMQSRAILSAVPHIQKAEAVRNTLRGDLSPLVPASLLKTHANWTLFLDNASASLL